jgi:hypothetical protein
MSGLPVEIRMEWISLDKGDKLKIKAAHILCAWESTLLCRRALNKIYRKKMGEYPLGRNMGFVPNIADKRFITTEATRKKVEMSVKKQRLWITHVSSAVSYIISDLDYYDTTIGRTLCQALIVIFLWPLIHRGTEHSFPYCSRRILRRKSTVSSRPSLWSYSTKWMIRFGTGSMRKHVQIRLGIGGAPRKVSRQWEMMMTRVGGVALVRVTMTQVTGPVPAAHPVYLAPLARQIATTWNPLISRQEREEQVR